MHTRSMMFGAKLGDPLRFAESARRWLGRVLATVALWRARSRKRRQLARWASVSGYGFIDGTSISSSEAYEEANKPFWKP
jgi:uncharacterized protein YjiS (DUF1127 family)